MKAGVSLYSFHGYKNSDLLGTKGCIEKAKELGFSGLDFIEFGNFSSRAEYISYASNIGSFCKDIGMEAVCFCVGADFINNSAKEETDRVKFLAEVAASLGCIYMRHDATRGPKNGDRSDESFENVLPALAEAYAEVTRYAKELGVKTCIENHGFFVQEAKRVKSIIDAVGDDNFGALIDIGNFMCADKEPTEEVKILTPHVFHAHAKDFHFRDGTLGAPEKGYFKTLAGNYLCGAILGQGCVDVEKCTNILKESGYDGYITLEFEGMEDPLLAIEMGKNDLSKYI